ncbi:hypothetical protein CPB86DRAFT_580306 [Serendipita vermifera]|nr:hypothetical protein CPB86DRAFT_580306 [Serendipita vermifera]
MTTTNAPLILVVNPNSSQSITDAIASSLNDVGNSLEFMTGPSSSPASINDEEDALQSAQACLPIILERMNQENAPSGVLVACYSDHPLVDMLKKDVTRPGFHTLDIFEASIKAAVKSIKPSEKFGVVTTGKAWEPLLTDGALRMLSEGGDDVEPDSFAGVVGTGLGVLELHNGDSSNVQTLMAQAAKDLVSKGAAAICLGCAGMSGLEAIVDSAVNTDDSAKKVKVIDGVKAGIEILRGLLAPGNA